MSPVLRVGLYGRNGHQIQWRLVHHPRAHLTALCGLPPEDLPPALREASRARWCADLDELLALPDVDLVSLCSPRRRDQARDAIRCLEAGKHVYAEKPCAMTETDLDAILAAAERSGRCFHEMAGTAFAQPYRAMRECIAAGTVGQVVQVLAQKSYPYHDGRPADEDMDGGLIRQAAVHALRMIEHVAHVRIRSIEAVETGIGNPRGEDGLRMAATLMIRLENGGVAAVIANYLNPRGTGLWGYEELRIFGDRGMLESTEGGRHTRLVVGAEDRGPLDASAPSLDYFDCLVNHLLDGTDMPLALEAELHPTRMAIRAAESARRRMGR